MLKFFLIKPFYILWNTYMYWTMYSVFSAQYVSVVLTVPSTCTCIRGCVISLLCDTFTALFMLPIHSSFSRVIHSMLNVRMNIVFVLMHALKAFIATFAQDCSVPTLIIHTEHVNHHTFCTWMKVATCRQHLNGSFDLKPLHTVGKVSVNASILHKNQEICNKTHMWKFQLISLFLLRENSKNAFSIFVFILMAGVFVSRDENSLFH